MSPSYAPDEDSFTIFLERTVVAADFITGVGYGIQLVMYTSCALYLFRQRKERRNSLFILAYITILLAIQTVFCAVQARSVQLMYVDNRNYPGGPWQYFLATQDQAINVIFYTTLFVVTFLSDLLVIWRCWVIWTSSGRVVAYLVTALPAMMLVASFVMGTLWTIQSTKPGLSLYSALPMAYGTSYYALSLSINIIITILIIFRLLFYRRNLLKRLPRDYAKHYVSLAAIIVESAAVYSVFAFIFLITYAVNNPVNQIFLAFASFTQQISAYLIIYRVANGRAFSNDTLTTQPLTTLQFAPKLDNPQAETFQLPVSIAQTSSTLTAQVQNKSNEERV